ncbi:MAG: 50S ribosomal protein L25 [bacterium]|nr:50S ribosomal protein L25 [bacterium]
MATKELSLSIERREKTGSGAAHALRKSGKIPGVLYGHGAEPMNLAIEARALDEVLHAGGRTGIITLTMDGKKADTALVRDLARDPLSHRVAHVDLQRVSAHEAVHAKLPVVTIGVPRGVKDFGGVMDVMVHEIEVEGPIDRMPDHLELDVTGLGIHQHAIASDIALPKGFKLLTAADTLVVSIEASKTAQHLEEAATGATAEQATPEVIGGVKEE